MSPSLKSKWEDPEVAYVEAKKRYPDKEIVLWKVPRSGTFIL